MPSSAEKLHPIEQNRPQTSLSHRFKQNEDLVFRTSPSSSYGAHASRQEHNVHREWVGRDGTPTSQTAGVQQKQRQQQRQEQSTCLLSPMMQRWQGEMSRDQPYNDVSKYCTMKKEADNKLAGGRPDGSKLG